MKATHRLLSAAAPVAYLAILAPIYLWGRMPAFSTILFHLANALLLLVISLLIDYEPARRLSAWFDRNAAAILTSIIAGLVVVFSILNYLKFINYGFVGEDFAIFAQSFYSTTYRHQLFATSYSPSLFSVHFDPFLFVLCPAYRLYPHPLVLIYAKVIALSLSMIPIYLIARDALSKAAGLAVAAGYIMSPAILSQFLFEFYDLHFAPLIIGLCIYFLLKSKKAYFYLCLIVLLSIREEMGIYAVALGLYSITIKRDRSWSAPVIITGITWIVAAYFFIIPHFSPSGGYPTFLITGRSGGLMSLEVCKNLMSVENIKLIYFLTAPLLFVLPFLDSACILSLPFIIGALLAGRLSNKWIGYHYYAFIEVGLFISCIRSLRHFSSRSSFDKEPGESVFLAKICIVIMLFVAVSLTSYQFISSMGNEIMAPYGWDGSVPLAEYKAALAGAIALIPPQAGIAVPRYTAPHLANRARVEYDLSREQPDYFLIDKHTGDTATLARINEKFLNNSSYLTNYKEIYRRNGVYLYKKAGPQ